ncbi:hypothetical protein FRC17_010867, partial [Serendipita sp. 399]
MGLLALGTPLTWEEASKYSNHVREHGIAQLINIWNRYKDRSGDKLLWGDEIEYMVLSFFDEEKDARLSLRQSEILLKLANICSELPCGPQDGPVPVFHPEYGRFMLESTPGAPYNGSVNDLLSVERNMRFRRSLAKKHLKANELPVTITSFPRLGVPGVFTDPYFEPAKAQASHKAQNGAALVDHVYMDAMGFGMGCCCLQITFQACSVAEARRVYDALVPVSSVMLALTAASPFWRGYVADVDCRWNVISGAVDDRTEEERSIRVGLFNALEGYRAELTSPKPLSKAHFQIPKSRYSSVDHYISLDALNHPDYNDLNAPYDKDIQARLIENGMDELLAKHFAHLFIRDPLVIFSESIDQDDATMSDHFENIQSTNWQTLRFKPPPPGSSMGWRVEFRSMEVQLTDFENAAFSIFI